MKILIIAVFLILSPGLLRASTEFDKVCRDAYSDILSLKFEDAATKIKNEKKLSPGNTIPFLLENYIDFIKVMVAEEDQDIQALHDSRDARLQLLAKGDNKSPWYLQSQAEIYLQSGICRFKFGEYVSGGMDINRAYQLLLENNAKFPSFPPTMSRLGLLHALIGTVPDKYLWIARAFNFQGSINQGIAEIRTAYKLTCDKEQYRFLMPETAFLLSYAIVNLSGDKESVRQIIKEFSAAPLSDWVESSPLICLSKVNMLAKTGANDQLISCILACKRSDGQFPLVYLDYLLGLAKLNRLDQDAHLPLLKYLASFHGKNYIRSAYQRLSWYYLMHGDTDKYTLYQQRILLRGNDIVDSDKQAKRDATSGSLPNVFLLKARLLFDGGYYEKSIAELGKFNSSPESSDPRFKLEYTYRMGRVCDDWGRIPEAITWYERTVNEGKDKDLYFAPNAALHLGLIYERAGKKTLAEKYYRSCLDMDFTDYSFSISQKAKAGLNRLKGK